MKNAVLVLASSLAAAAGTYRAVQPDPSPSAVAATVGFVDLSRLLNADPAYKAAEKEIDDWKGKEQVGLDQGVKDYEMKVANLESFEPGSESARQLGEELAVQEAKLKFRRNALNAELEARRARALKDAYLRIRKAAETVRQQNGLLAVFQYNPTDPVGQNRDQLAAEIVARTVMAVDMADADVTLAVQALLGK